MIVLNMMTEDDFVAFKKTSVADYAQDLMKENSLSLNEALKEAEKEFDKGLPNGIETKDSFVMNIEDDRGILVGRIWYEYGTDSSGERQVFLCDLLIFEPERRKGYASAALDEMNARAKASGCVSSALFVWDHNPAGMRLYEKCGYKPAARGDGGCYMIKKL